jgi:hypothetical protein
MADATGAPKDLEGFLDYYFVKKAPFQIPAAGREWIVRFGPWIVIVLLVLSLPAILLLLGIGATWTPLTLGGYRWSDTDPYRWGYAYWYWPLMSGLVVHFALMALALPGLFARKMSGWRLVFYAQIVSLVAGVLAMNLVGALIGALIAFYLLFQIRPLYK